MADASAPLRLDLLFSGEHTQCHIDGVPKDQRHFDDDHLVELTWKHLDIGELALFAANRHRSEIDTRRVAGFLSGFVENMAILQVTPLPRSVAFLQLVDDVLELPHCVADDRRHEPIPFATPLCVAPGGHAQEDSGHQNESWQCAHCPGPPFLFLCSTRYGRDKDLMQQTCFAFAREAWIAC